MSGIFCTGISNSRLKMLRTARATSPKTAILVRFKSFSVSLHNHNCGFRGSFSDAGLMLDVQLGDIAQVRYVSPTLHPRDGTVEFEGKLDLARLLSLLPPRGHNPS